MTKIIYLIGKPGTGKYTIAKELAKSGYIICDNHHINNSIFGLMNLDGKSAIPEYAWISIRKIRANIFEFLSLEKNNNYVLTNEVLHHEHHLFDQVKDMAANRGSLFVPVKLLISHDENIKRVQNIERLKRFKTINPESLNKTLIDIEHPNLLELDVTEISAIEASMKILNHTNNLYEK